MPCGTPGVTGMMLAVSLPTTKLCSVIVFCHRGNCLSICSLLNTIALKFFYKPSMTQVHNKMLRQNQVYRNLFGIYLFVLKMIQDVMIACMSHGADVYI